MQKVIIVLVAFSAGALLLWFRKEFAVLCIKDQNQLWGFRFGKRSAWWTEIVVVIVGLGFLIVGLLCLLGVGRVK